MYHNSPTDLQNRASVPPKFFLELIYIKFDGR